MIKQASEQRMLETRIENVNKMAAVQMARKFIYFCINIKHY